jgi:uncharacterized membrane protein YeaQ/YmgE (transglycosylase-associated protein family)
MKTQILAVLGCLVVILGIAFLASEMLYLYVDDGFLMSLVLGLVGFTVLTIYGTAVAVISFTVLKRME